MGLSLSKIFSGVGIHVIWKTPQFLAGFLGRNNPTDDATKDAGKTGKLSQADKQTEDAIRDSYKSRGLDYDRPTNIK